MSKFRDFQPGTTVKMSGKWLRSTGSLTGSAHFDRFAVQACDCPMCQRGEHVAVNQPSDFFTPEEIALDPSLAWRHIAKENLVVAGQMDHRNCP